MSPEAVVTLRKKIVMENKERQDKEESEKNITTEVDDNKVDNTISVTDRGTAVGTDKSELDKTTEVTELDEERDAAELSDEISTEKKILSMHAIKCKCGNILSSRMKHCPECGKDMEVLLEELRQDFYRINFTYKPR